MPNGNSTALIAIGVTGFVIAPDQRVADGLTSCGCRNPRQLVLGPGEQVLIDDRVDAEHSIVVVLICSEGDRGTQV